MTQSKLCFMKHEINVISLCNEILIQYKTIIEGADVAERIVEWIRTPQVADLRLGAYSTLSTELLNECSYNSVCPMSVHYDGVGCHVVSAAWHSCVAAHLYHCYNQSKYDFRCLKGMLNDQQTNKNITKSYLRAPPYISLYLLYL